MEYSKNISQTQITRRWVWSRLCGFPQCGVPGDARSLDCRSLYKRAEYYYGLKPYTIRRAAESLGVYPRKDVEYRDDSTLKKPYEKGWRYNQWSWSTVRNPLWKDNLENIGKGYCNWACGAPRGSRSEDVNDFLFETERNVYNWLNEHGTPRNEFHYQRPELFSDGYTDNSIDYIIRRFFINEFLFLMKIDDEDSEGTDLFEAYDIEQIYGGVCQELATMGRDCSREHFRVVLYGLGFTMEGRGKYYRTHGARPFLDVVDKIKIGILEKIEKKEIREGFDLPSLWKKFNVQDSWVGERMLFDAAVSELLYEGFLRTFDFIKGVNSQVLHFDGYAEEPSSRSVDKRLVYLHTLNSERKKFPQQKPILYGKYIGL